MNSRPRQLCYPQGSFSVTPSPQQKGHRGSLGPAFAPAPLSGRGTVRPAFALALHGGFLTHLSRPLGAGDIFSPACRPSQTAHQLLSLPYGRLAPQVEEGGVTLATPEPLSGFLRRLPPTLYSPTRDATAGCSEVPGVFATHRRSLAFTPGRCVRRVPAGDSGEVVTPFAKPSFKRQGIALA